MVQKKRREFIKPMVPYTVFSASLTLCLLFTFGDASSIVNNQISINCGSTATSRALDGGEWLGDHVCPKSSFLSIEGPSTVSSVSGELWTNIDAVPYRTARISVSRFSYSFQLNPGQKFIRLHFYPTSYFVDKGFKDLFTVEAGPFILLANFSASMTARALGHDTFAKEFCITLQESHPLNIILSPASATSPSQDKFYAFINGIEIISVPSGISYSHAGDIGVQVVGQKSVIYIDNTSALELVHRQSIRSDFGNVHDMFGIWATIHEAKATQKNVTWRVSVDVGFSYLVRFHFCELGVKLAETQGKNVILIINNVTVTTSADILQDREDIDIPWYKNYMVMVKGHNPEGNHDILISLHCKDGIIMGGRGPLEGFEIFKLSNEANSLASPTSNSWPPTQRSSSWTSQSLLAFLGCRNMVATGVITVICLLNIIAYKLRQNWKFNFCEEETRLPIRAKQLCRRFSLPEIQLATDNFFKGCIIGKGGFGKVYKGFIDNRQQTVAIKRLKSNSSQGKSEFWTEVETLSVLQHVNLVSLIGYCNEQREMILVYEYLPSGTLADHLYKLSTKSEACSTLSWKQRLEICIGAGRGLDYLHTGHGIIHRDIKTSNILLDENFVPKVADFGLAKIDSEGELQRQASTNVKGTFGYLDPDYFRTRMLTTKSDTYSFGVVLLEVLCGRPAVEPWADEDKRSLTMWAQVNISKGEVYQIVDPNLREEISPDSLKTFVGVAERCLHNIPKKRPAIAYVIINLEFALEQHENGKALPLNGKTSVADFFPCTHKASPDDASDLSPNEIVSIADDKARQDNVNSLEPAKMSTADALPFTDNVEKENLKPLLHKMMSSVTKLTCYDTTFLSKKMKQVTPHLKEYISGKVNSAGKRDGRKTIIHQVTSHLKEYISCKVVNAGKRDGEKTVMHNLLRILPWHASRNTAKQSKKKEMASISVSAPIWHGISIMTLRGSAVSESWIYKTNDELGDRAANRVPKLDQFTFSELKKITRNFRSVIGAGGFGTVYQGWFDETLGGKPKCESLVAVKRLNPESVQGLLEWQSEVKFLGWLLHPNLVKLLGYCWEDKELLLVYENMPEGSLELHLFGSGPAVKPLGWNNRLNILIGAARAFAFLHESDNNIIYRDLKSSNILLDESFNAKLSDFGLAKLGPSEGSTHVSTQVMGTYGYAAPEYIATGHLYMKSDVYGFGVITIEMLTGLRVFDTTRPSGQQNLVDWVIPFFRNKRKLKVWMDSRLDGRYPTTSACQMAQLAGDCVESDPKKRPHMQEVVEKLERMDLFTPSNMPKSGNLI